MHDTLWLIAMVLLQMTLFVYDALIYDTKGKVVPAMIVILSLMILVK